MKLKFLRCASPISDLRDKASATRVIPVRNTNIERSLAAEILRVDYALQNFLIGHINQTDLIPALAHLTENHQLCKTND